MAKKKEKQDSSERLPRKEYEQALKALHIELVKLQQWWWPRV